MAINFFTFYLLYAKLGNSFPFEATNFGPKFTEFEFVNELSDQFIWIEGCFY